MRNSPEIRAYLDERIVHYIERNGININRIYDDITRKKKFLQEVLGYTRLRTGKNQFAFLDQCEDTRISVVVRDSYTNAKKRLEKHKKQPSVTLEESVKSFDF